MLSLQRFWSAMTTQAHQDDYYYISQPIFAKSSSCCFSLVMILVYPKIHNKGYANLIIKCNFKVQTKLWLAEFGIHQKVYCL